MPILDSTPTEQLVQELVLRLETSPAETEWPSLDVLARALGAWGGIRVVLDAARGGDVGVVWEDRTTIGTRLEVDFTDEQWARIAPHLDDFDEWTDGAGEWEGRREFAERCLERAGLTVIDDVDGDTSVIDRPYCRDCLQPRTAAADRHCRAMSTRTYRADHRWSDEVAS